MQFTVEDHNMGNSYIVHFEDGTYALVDSFNGDVYRDDPDFLMSQGYWVEASEHPVSEEELEEIKALLEHS